MMLTFDSAVRNLFRSSLVFGLILLCSIASAAQGGRSLYDQIKAFSLTGGKADVNGLAFKRDRAEMTFTGTFYFTAPTDGHVTGAVFVGQGTFRAQSPPAEFEKANLKRLIG